MSRTAALSLIVVLVVACADETEPPPSIAEQLGDGTSPSDGDALPDDDGESGRSVDVAEPSPDDDQPQGSDGLEDGAEAGEVDDDLQAAVAEADARCADIYTRGDELAFEQQAGLWVALAEGDAAALDAYGAEAARDEAIALTEEVVVSLELAAEGHAGLEPLATHARQDVLPFLGDLLSLLFEGRPDDADALAARHWQQLTSFVDDLAELGFEHCFQTELLP